MKCEDLPEESYAFFVLGSSTPVERELIERHLTEQCPHCTAEVSAYRNVWYGVACESPAEKPPRTLRRRVLAATGAGPRLRWLPTPALAFAAGAVLMAGILYTDQILKPSPRIVLATVHPPASADPRPGPSGLEPKYPESGTKLDSEPGLDAELERLRGDLAREREKTSLLQSQIEQNRTETASAEKPTLRAPVPPGPIQPGPVQPGPVQMETGADDRRYRDALASAQAKSDTLSARLSDALTRVSTLENEVTQYKQLLDLERRRADRQVSIASIVTSPSLRVIPLKGTERDPAIQGRVLLAGTTQMLFTASNLPPLPSNRVYQLWLLRADAPAIASAGTFQPDKARQAMVQSANSAILSGVTAVAVTDEPAGGSLQPTGRKWIVGL